MREILDNLNFSITKYCKIIELSINMEFKYLTTLPSFGRVNESWLACECRHFSWLVIAVPVVPFWNTIRWRLQNVSRPFHLVSLSKIRNMELSIRKRSTHNNRTFRNIFTFPHIYWMYTFILCSLSRHLPGHGWSPPSWWRHLVSKTHWTERH